MKKYSKKEVVELLRECDGRRDYSSCIDIDTFLKERGFIEEEFEVGKWYRDSEGYFCFYKTEEQQYGMLKNGGDWFDECYWMKGRNLNDDWFLATDKEVETALIKEAKKIGFDERPKYLKYPWNTDSDTHKPSYGCGYELIDGRLYFGDTVLFRDGKWAEIVVEEMTMEQLCKELGRTVKIVKS